MLQEYAEQLDAMPASDRQRLPLFGIPLSVKENEEVAGYCACMGYSSVLGNVSTQTSPRVKVCKSLGWVLALEFSLLLLYVEMLRIYVCIYVCMQYFSCKSCYCACLIVTLFKNLIPVVTLVSKNVFIAECKLYVCNLTRFVRCRLVMHSYDIYPYVYYTVSRIVYTILFRVTF